MKKLVFVFYLFMCTILFSSCSEIVEYPDGKYTVFENINYIDVLSDSLHCNKFILIKDSLIYQILDKKPSNYPESIEIIDAKDKFLIPGLFDMHAHVTVLPLKENGWLAENMDSAISVQSLKTFLEYGITTVRNTASPKEDGVKIRNWAKNKKIQSPNIFTSGAALNRSKAFFGPFSPVKTKNDVKNEIRNQHSLGVDFIKVYSTLTPDLIKAAVDEAHKLGLDVIGHLQRTSWTEAAKLGIDGVCHAAPWTKSYLPDNIAENYRGTMLDRLDWIENVDMEGDKIRELIREMVNNGVYWDPTLIAMHTKFWGDDSLYIYSKNNAIVHPEILKIWENSSFVGDWKTEDFERSKKLWNKLASLTKLMFDAGVTILAGSDFPNPWVVPGISLHQELELLHKAGLKNIDVIKTATINCAKILKIDQKYGSITVGKKADLVLLNNNPLCDILNTKDIFMVFKEGKKFSN